DHEGGSGKGSRQDRAAQSGSQEASPGVGQCCGQDGGHDSEGGSDQRRGTTVDERSEGGLRSMTALRTRATPGALAERVAPETDGANPGDRAPEVERLERRTSATAEVAAAEVERRNVRDGY
ncbi:MAG: hypothetical protein JWN47_395, partial [Frankiales bacterium]|nr:hypothetical protein [Frankiales bacterium]